MMDRLLITTTGRTQAVDLTEQVGAVITRHAVREGVCLLFVTHTTAALTTGEVGEGTEEDLLDVVEAMIPKLQFRHAHDPSHAWSHMASSILGPSLAVPISEGRLVLGTWQSILLIELDGPRRREVRVTLLPGA
ncbi:secondary thiamine-phosphate synthase enzyme YjbQ [Candidatus Nitrospira bockiana]